MSIEFHRMLLNDEIRMSAYGDAIHAAVKPGDVVLDLGTGSGILAFFACQAGAARVYAVERSNSVVLAQKLAQANGFDDRITFLHTDVFELDLPEPVDVIVSELVSKAVLGQHMAETIGHCRDRFLSPDGRIVPEQISLLIAPVEAPDLHAGYAYPAASNYGIDFQPNSAWAMNRTTSAKVPDQSLLAAGQVAYDYNALTAPLEDRIHTNLAFETERTAQLHGYCAWFSARLATDGEGKSIRLSNHPPGIASWDNLFFPLPHAVDTAAHTRIELRLDANDTRQQPLFWAWRTQITPPPTNGTTEQRPAVVFDQSTVKGQLFSASGWHRRAGTFVPQLSEAGQIDRLVLDRMNTGFTLNAIADDLCESFPHRFAEREQAIAHVGDLSERYSTDRKMTNAGEQP